MRFLYSHACSVDATGLAVPMKCAISLYTDGSELIVWYKTPGRRCQRIPQMGMCASMLAAGWLRLKRGFSARGRTRGSVGTSYQQRSSRPVIAINDEQRLFS